MKFILVNQQAASELIQERTLQSTEFDAGERLVRILRGEALSNISRRIRTVETTDGRFLLSRTEGKERFIVFDLAQADLFSNRPSSEALLVFQRVLRFAIRKWTHQRLSPHEVLIDVSTKVAVFPFQDDAKQYRVTIECRPDPKREKNEQNENHYLVYKHGSSPGERAKEVAEVKNFRLALKGFDDARKRFYELLESDAATTNLTSYAITQLDSSPPPSVGVHIGFDNWLKLLTAAQREFVTRPVSGPERIEGPAGTGKTLCLVLKCIQNLRTAETNGSEHHSLFLVHSEAVRSSVQEIFDANDTHGYHKNDRNHSSCSVEVTTLQTWCTRQLASGISETECLDRDAMDSKIMQLMYIEEAVSQAFEKELPTFRKLLSPRFLHFLETESRDAIHEMIQHEIAVVIKGRIEESAEAYNNLPNLDYNLPLENGSDRSFVYLIFRLYQDRLRAVNQFDTDDIVLSAIGQLRTPIWRRRRALEGYDSIFIDETHLFNLNEMSVFHFLPRVDSANTIVFSADRAQAIGDRGLTDAGIISAVLATPAQKSSTKTTRMGSVFRCSPQIIELAFSITSSGATLFTNFDDPLTVASSIFTAAEEQKCTTPEYRSYPTDALLVASTFDNADEVVRQLDCKRSDVLIVAFDNQLFWAIKQEAERLNKPLEVLKERGSVETVARARTNGRYVVGLPEYVGGLEFHAAILVGVDKGRVPPVKGSASTDSNHFLTYIAHNQLYVSVTRARYRVLLSGTSVRGPSSVLANAFQKKALVEGASQ